MNEQQKNQYLKDVNECNERVRQHVLQEQTGAVEAAQFERVPMPQMGLAPPMLEKNATTGSSSTLEMWEENVDQRLNDIDNKMTKTDLNALFSKGSVAEMDF